MHFPCISLAYGSHIAARGWITIKKIHNIIQKIQDDLDVRYSKCAACRNNVYYSVPIRSTSAAGCDANFIVHDFLNKIENTVFYLFMVYILYIIERGEGRFLYIK